MLFPNCATVYWGSLVAKQHRAISAPMYVLNYWSCCRHRWESTYAVGDELRRPLRIELQKHAGQDGYDIDDGDCTASLLALILLVELKFILQLFHMPGNSRRTSFFVSHHRRNTCQSQRCQICVTLKKKKKREKNLPVSDDDSGGGLITSSAVSFWDGEVIKPKLQQWVFFFFS